MPPPSALYYIVTILFYYITPPYAGVGMAGAAGDGATPPMTTTPSLMATIVVTEEAGCWRWRDTTHDNHAITHGNHSGNRGGGVAGAARHHPMTTTPSPMATRVEKPGGRGCWCCATPHQHGEQLRSTSGGGGRGRCQRQPHRTDCERKPSDVINSPHRVWLLRPCSWRVVLCLRVGVAVAVGVL